MKLGDFGDFIVDFPIKNGDSPKLCWTLTRGDFFENTQPLIQ